MVFGLKGWLNRKPYWIVSIILLVIVIAIGLAGAVTGSMMMQQAFLSGGPVDGAFAVAAYTGLAALLLVLYPATAVMVKRIHDLGKSGKWVLLLLIPTLAKFATDLLGLTGGELTLAQMEIDISSGEIPTYFEAMQKQITAEIRIRPAEFAVDVFNFVISLWYFVWLGFFRGTRGANQYGPDPLESAKAA